jgi:Helicase associated domain
VPQHYRPNKSLGKWVAKQREQYKLRLKGQHSFLTPYREEKLNQVGFSWYVRNALDTELQSAMDERNPPDTSMPTTTTTDEDTGTAAAPDVQVKVEDETNAPTAVEEEAEESKEDEMVEESKEDEMAEV